MEELTQSSYLNGFVCVPRCPVINGRQSDKTGDEICDGVGAGQARQQNAEKPTKMLFAVKHSRLLPNMPSFLGLRPDEEVLFVSVF